MCMYGTLVFALQVVSALAGLEGQGATMGEVCAVFAAGQSC